MSTIRRHARVYGWLLLAASCLFSLLLAEVCVRVFFPHARDHVVPANLFGMDEQLGWRLQPSRSAVHEPRYFRVVYRTNALGYRDRERSRELPAGVSRILLFGDSYLFGWGVDEAQRFSNLLEGRRQSHGTWHDVRV